MCRQARQADNQLGKVLAPLRRVPDVWEIGVQLGGGSDSSRQARSGPMEMRWLARVSVWELDKSM